MAQSKTLSNVDYYKALFLASVTEKATITSSLEEILQAKAVSLGCSPEQAKEDVRRVLNLNEATMLVLERMTKPGNYE